MILRDYCNNDLEAIEKINSFCAISIKYHGDILPENILCITDEKEKIIGVGYLKFNKKNQIKGKQIIEFSTFIIEEHTEDIEVYELLMDGLIKKFHEIKKSMPERELCLRICCETDEINDMQFFLKKGFNLNSVIPVLKYDLFREIEHYQIPDNVHIHEYAFTNESIKKYVNADLMASGKPESESDIWFKTGDASFKCFVATCNSEVIGAISVWNINNERAATENIFVMEPYRRKNIARELIATAFDELKKRDMKIATLSMKGTNLPAMKLYLSSGYSLYYNLIEMIYE